MVSSDKAALTYSVSAAGTLRRFSLCCLALILGVTFITTGGVAQNSDSAPSNAPLSGDVSQAFEIAMQHLPRLVGGPGQGGMSEGDSLLLSSWAEQNQQSWTLILDRLRDISKLRTASGIDPLPISDLPKDQLEFFLAARQLNTRYQKHLDDVDAAINSRNAMLQKEAERRDAECKSTVGICFNTPYSVGSEIPISAALSDLLAMRFSLDVKVAEAEDKPLTAKITQISMSDDLYKKKVEDAEVEVISTAEDYRLAAEKELLLRNRFEEGLRTHASKIAPIDTEIETLRKRLRSLRVAAFKPNTGTATIENSPQHQNTRNAIRRQEAVLARLNRRIEQVKEFGGSKEALQQSLDTLAAGIKKTNTRIAALEQELSEIGSTGTSDTAAQLETDAMRDLQEKIKKAQWAHSLEDASLRDRSEALLAQSGILEQKDEAYAAALDTLEALKARRARPLLQVRTTDTFDAEYTNKYAEMRDLNRAIKLSRQATFEADYQREKARSAMLRADEDASNASENLERGIMNSAKSQLLLEAYMQAKEGIDASKAGPGVFLIWATNRVAQNLFNPPKVYEPEYRLDGQQSVSQQILESYFVKDKQEAASRTAKYGTSKTYDHLLTAGKDTLKLGSIEKEMQKIIAQQRGGQASTKTLASLLTRYKAQEALYKEAGNAMSARMFSSGKVKVASKISGDLLKSQLKSMGVEAIKRQMADFFEGDAWRSYMRAQQRFVLAVRIFRVNGNIYWRNRDHFEGLLSLREAIKGKYYDEKSKLQIETSEAFDVKGGERFWVIFADENGEPSKEPHPGRLNVFLNDTPLDRKRGSNIFDLSDVGAKALRRQGDKELSLKLVFE
ncbi:MAG: hypothetical protein ABJN26_24685 [Stappiaceae bacterium]